jgi:hypothetical protein
MRGVRAFISKQQLTRMFTNILKILGDSLNDVDSDSIATRKVYIDTYLYKPDGRQSGVEQQVSVAVQLGNLEQTFLEKTEKSEEHPNQLNSKLITVCLNE